MGQDVICINCIHMFAGRQHRHHNFRAAYSSSTRFRGHTAGSDGCLHCFFRRIKGARLVAGFYQIGGHAAFHVAEANKSDARHDLRLL